MVREQAYGIIDGRPVSLYTLRNSSGSEVLITNFGGIVTSLKVPDRKGRQGEVVLGLGSLEEYLVSENYFGCLVGRYANRIAGARFSIDGHEYHLSQNDGSNHLHGGLKGFDKVLWDGRLFTTREGEGLELSYVSVDGEEGYPGNLRVRVNYLLTENNSLLIDYQATSDAKTIVCLTHHSYFNLSKELTILNHLLEVRADHYTPVGEQQIPTGVREDVAGIVPTGLDFRKPIKIADALGRAGAQLLAGGLDHNFVLSKGKRYQPAAILYDPVSGRKLEMVTSEPGLQIYTGNYLDGSSRDSAGNKHQKYGGICLEAQHFPDSPNQPGFPSVFLGPKDVYRQTTEYKFSVIS